MSSSSSSTLPLSTPPLPQLPVELIGQIIESSVPSQYHSLTFPQRQTTLRNLCLTCRLFRQLAQPLLEQFDHLHLSESGIDSSRRQEDLKLTRVLSVTVLSKRPLGSIESLVLEHPNLEELHIYSRWKDYRFIDVSRLSSLTSLTNLTISWTDARLPIPASFPSLRYLTIYRSNENEIASLLQPSVLPSLRVLALLYALPYYENIDFEALLSRLDLLIGTPCTVECFENDKELTEKHGDKILMDVRYDEISGELLPTVQHVRIRVTPGEMLEERSKFSQEERIDRWSKQEPWKRTKEPNSEGNLNEAFNWLWDSRCASKIAYKTLFFDHGLYEGIESFQGMQDSYEHIIEMCDEDRTEVVMEEQPVSKSADSAITPELLRWIDKRKSKRQSEGEA